jgi:HEPN domain-containing protein
VAKMNGPKYIPGTPAAWLNQAEHDAQDARTLAEDGRWALAILQAFEAIEKALKAVGLEPMTYGGMEQFTYGELERFTYGQLEGKVRPSHEPKAIIGPQHAGLPPVLLSRVKALDMEKERLRLRYPDGGPLVPHQRADESRAREVLAVMDGVMEAAIRTVRGK